MAAELSAPPVLSTPAEYMFDDDTAVAASQQAQSSRSRTDHELAATYEIERTAIEIVKNGWQRVALQFPDAMLGDAGWVIDALTRELTKAIDAAPEDQKVASVVGGDSLETDVNAKERNVGVEREEKKVQIEGQAATVEADAASKASSRSIARLYVLADTSYSSCCVDEIAAEHATSDAVVHYGRSCLSPTSRLPVLHIFTRQELDHNAVIEALAKEFGGNKDEKIVLMADVMFQEHVTPICEKLRGDGWKNITATELVRDPMAVIPNRRLIRDAAIGAEATTEEESTGDESSLKDHHLFHIAIPPTALLLTLSSRLASLHIYSVPSSPYAASSSYTPDPSTAPALLRRRYGLVIRLVTASIIGILVNTLSVANYLPTINKLKEQIAAAGKKSYTIVVGKLNAAKLANFAEIDGWVVVGCWESGLVEQEGLWKPVITPFELGLALVGDDKRVWDGSWWAGIEGVPGVGEAGGQEKEEEIPADKDQDPVLEEVEGGVDEEESEPPVFDLRTGKLVSNSRPMRVALRGQTNGTSQSATASDSTDSQDRSSSALIHRAKAGEIAMINGVVSPGAEYLRSQRTWQGLGSDFRNEDGEDEESTLVEEGRSGVARGYTVGEDEDKS
ncbi:putative diphthamide synthesis protein-domain-containing protein [Xylariales sp. PMI_506]|nr:putative diphthamide synthesis protein-domain-containing protein [Xylariales sp. PMI_506]